MGKIIYPLLSDAFNKKDIQCGINVIKSKFITMSKVTRRFEKKFAKKVGSKFALMTNSGSSANLLAVSAIVNPMFKKQLKEGDEVLIPSVCWSTSLWPIIQNNLKPVFVDVEMNTFNISIDHLIKKITKKTTAIMCVHILGTSANMNKIKKIAKLHKLLIIEDTCESLGAKFNNKCLGTFGEFGTYSFFISHQITSGEGGMIVCNDKLNYNIVKSLRSHGWSRDIVIDKKIKKKFKKIDDRFLFINSGYNLRPTDIQAAIAENQLKRLSKFMKVRKHNRELIIKKIKLNKKWSNQFNFVNVSKKIEPSWFGLPIIVNNKFKNKKKKFLDFLTKKGIENRPILSGNFLNQPSIELYKLKTKKDNFKNAQNVEDLGFFIGLHTTKLSNKLADYIAENLLSINEI